MIFDGQVNLVGIDAIGPDVDNGEEITAESPVLVTLTLGINLPIPTQQGLALAPIPAMRMTARMSGDQARELAEKLATAAEPIPEMPKESPLVATPGDMEQAIAAQQAVEKMKG